jgi:hypothetical protein
MRRKEGQLIRVVPAMHKAPRSMLMCLILLAMALFAVPTGFPTCTKEKLEVKGPEYQSIERSGLINLGPSELALTSWRLGSIPATTRRIPPAVPWVVSSITNSTSAAAPLGTFSGRHEDVQSAVPCARPLTGALSRSTIQLHS